MKRNLLIIWLPLVAASTIILGSVYVVIQQGLRQSANSPQIELSEDGAKALAGGISAGTFVSADKSDISKSLVPFTIVYDESGNPITSSGFLDGTAPVPPRGVFEYARTHADDRLTWQPEPNTRIAAVVKHFQGASSGFILVGRSLRDVEIRESQAEFIFGFAWILTVLVTLLVTASATAWLRPRS